MSDELIRIANQVRSELAGRLECDLGDRDALAISTALTKAAWRGFFEGVATNSEATNEQWAKTFAELRPQLPPSVQLPDKITTLFPELDPDFWRTLDAWANPEV